jgi:hypothetical protein
VDKIDRVLFQRTIPSHFNVLFHHISTYHPITFQRTIPSHFNVLSHHISTYYPIEFQRTIPLHFNVLFHHISTTIPSHFNVLSHHISTYYPIIFIKWSLSVQQVSLHVFKSRPLACKTETVSTIPVHQFEPLPPVSVKKELYYFRRVKPNFFLILSDEKRKRLFSFSGHFTSKNKKSIPVC